MKRLYNSLSLSSELGFFSLGAFFDFLSEHGMVELKKDGYDVAEKYNTNEFSFVEEIVSDGIELRVIYWTEKGQSLIIDCYFGEDIE